MSEPPLYERDPEAWNKYLAEGNVKQARKRVAVDALLRDRNGRVLVVKPNYKPGWDLPGGMVEANEAPVDGLRRELAEELGLHVPSFRLLCIDWVPPHGPWDDQLSFIFDGGVVTTKVRVSASDSELTEVRFVDRGELRSLLRDRLWRRTEVALDVLQRQACARYLHDGVPPAGVDFGEVMR
ncbi:MAG TPA: NUDIX hydrolase [Candidatus Dormibacteraeota bacterium]|jgi:8-oxo-dGTP diphosphatase|nr:NUDIX hydrolase [Candidatus Dormibacteraeota bacterium]